MDSGSQSGTFFLSFFFFEQTGGATWWRVGYQRGLPRLVYMSIVHNGPPSEADWPTDLEKNIFL